MKFFRLLVALFVGMTLIEASAEPRQRGADAKASEMKNPIEPNEASIKQGEALYRRFCLTCHGIDGTGKTDMADMLDVPPSDFTDGKWDYGKSDGEIFSVIKFGGQNGMEPFAAKLNDQRIWHVVNFLKTFQKAEEGEVVAARPDVPTNPIEATDASIRRGQQYYLRFCVTCHGRNGKGDTEMREFLSTHPSDFTNGEWKYGDRDGDIFLVIKNGTEYDMEAFEGRLTDENTWHVVNYLRSMAGGTQGE